MDMLQAINDFYYHMSLYELRMMNGKDQYDGLSYNSLLYLNVIDLMQNCTVSSLAKTLGVTKSAVTLKVAELEKQGALIKTQSQADKRVHFLRIAPHIKCALTKYDEVFAKTEKMLCKRYSEEQLALFCEVLAAVSQHEWREET